MRRLAGHLLVAALAAVFVILGFWQLSRLRQREAHNEGIRAQMRRPPAESLTQARTWQRVRLRGTFDAAAQVLVAGKALKDRPGSYVLTPLRTSSGAVWVNRGWIPIEQASPPAPPAGIVEVRGVLEPPESPLPFTPKESPPGTLKTVTRVDVPRLARQIPYPVISDWMLATSPTGGPEAVPLPELSQGPHLSYAIQWFLFAGVLLVGYGFAVRPRPRRMPARAETPGI